MNLASGERHFAEHEAVRDPATKAWKLDSLSGAGARGPEDRLLEGATFAQALSRAGLVDEYRLVIHPAALGEGMPLFRGLPSRLALELVEAHTYETGAAIHVYRPRAAG